MDFISRHYEKMILAGCLIFLLVCLKMVQTAQVETVERLQGESVKSQRSVDQGNEVEEISDEAYVDLNQVSNDPRRLFKILGKGRRQGALFAPSSYIICKNMSCRSIIPMAVDQETLNCPFCGEVQPNVSLASDGRDDMDGDGIPDEVEAKTPFLDPLNPQDARQDEDKDGFLNVEEYLAGTKMDDPTSIPPLGQLLRFDNIEANILQVQLRDLDKNGSEDPRDWTINIRVPHPRYPLDYPDPKRSQNKGVRIGDVIRSSSKNAKEPAYVFTEAGYEDINGESVPYAVLKSTTDDKEEYRLHPDEEMKEQKPVVQFVYLANRIKGSEMQARTKNAFSARIGDVLPSLKKNLRSDDVNKTLSAKDRTVVEFYKLESVDEDSEKVVVVKVDSLKAEPTEQSPRIIVPELDLERDFYVPIVKAVEVKGNPLRRSGMMP